jgi:choline-sulfatase
MGTDNIKRRRFMQTAAAGTASAAMGCGNAENKPSAGKKTPPKDRPNVLIIMTDQHRADLMTCLGNDLVPTPNIDRIAARGVRFDNTYCPYPVCVASRMAMLTGLYSHTTGSITNRDQLDWRYRTMAHHFGDNGYLSGLVGKMHFNSAYKHGFEFYMSINDWLLYLGPKVQHYANEIASHPHNTYFTRTVDDSGAGFPDIETLWDGEPNNWVGNVTRSDFKTMASELDTGDHLDSFIARESVKFMKENRDHPFFLITSFMKPHTPFFPPKEWADKYPVDEMDLRPVNDPASYPEHIRRRIEGYKNRDLRLMKAGRAGYLGNLAFADSCVGQVYDALEELGLIDNTIVVYTSDHGEMDGTHGMWQKFCLFEPSVKVPFVVSWPGNLAEGEVSDALTELAGLYPTLSDLCGLEKPESTTIVNMDGAPESMDAESFADIVRDPGLEGADAAFSEYNLRSEIPSYMIREKQYKYVFNHGGTHELYDLESDPGENVNLIGNPDLRSVADGLRDKLFAWYDPESNSFRAKP